MKMREIMDLIESAGDDFDGYLYHATPVKKVAKIEQDGITPVSYWGTSEIVAYYAEDIRDNGSGARIYRVPLSAFDQSLLEPDQPGLEEPLTYTLGMSEEEVWEAWQASDQTWRACLDLIGSVRYRGVIPPTVLES